MLEEHDITCPYCDAPITVMIDASAGDQCYVEDCSVCCQPIVMSARIDVEGHVTAVETGREND